MQTLKARFSRVRRAHVAALAGALAVSATAAVVIAQAAPPTVNVSVQGGGRFAVTGGEGLKAGPTQFVFKNVSSRERSTVMVLLKPGVTVEQFTAEAKKVKDDPSRVYGLGSFETGTDLSPKRTHRTTITLKEGTYVIYDITRGAIQGPVITVGAGPNGATGPKPDATIRMKDYAFSLPSTLDRSGTFRFRNVGDDPHFAIAFRLKKGVRSTTVVDGFRRGDESVGEHIAGVGNLLGVVSPGTTNDVRYRFRPGRYVMVCFFSDRKTKGKEHSLLGMERAFKVE